MRNNVKALFIWDVDAELKKHLKKSLKNVTNIKLVFPNAKTEKNIHKESLDADIIIGWRPSYDMLEKAEKLKLFINPGTGVKHHIENFRKINKVKKVILVNGHGHAYATAQHTVAMLLALMNRVNQHHNWMINGVWRTSDDKDISSSSVPLKNRNIGLLGYGAINKYVHKFLSGFENKFHILKRSWTEKDKSTDPLIKKYSPKDLNKFLAAADILIIAIPHTVETEKLIGKKELNLLGENGFVVNVARGTIIDEKSLYDTLKNKTIAGAALDVWYNYNPEKDKKGKAYPYNFPFHKLDNILMSPHRAASPFDDLGRWDEVIENIKRFTKGSNDLMNVVDLKREY